MFSFQESKTIYYGAVVPNNPAAGANELVNVSCPTPSITAKKARGHELRTNLSASTSKEEAPGPRYLLQHPGWRKKAS